MEATTNTVHLKKIGDEIINIFLISIFATPAIQIEG